jgi:UDP-glucose 4-epimerase
MNTGFRDKNVLITGGMGFLGSNLAIALVNAGAHVTIVDAMIPGYGGNLFNIAPIREYVTLNYCDVRDSHAMNYLVRDKNYIFHLAGQVDHVMSLTNPFPDIDINIQGTAVLMEACKHYNPQGKVIYTGTRGQYGEVAKLPVDETAPMIPKALHEISNLTAEQIVHMYHSFHKVRSVMLRLTNIYGPRAQMLHPRYGVVNWFVRLAVDNQTIKVFGDGTIIRDFLYVEDCIEALIACALCEDAYGDIFNVASGIPCRFVELVETLVAAANSGQWEYAPFTPERAAQEPGDFYADISKIQRIVGWRPRFELQSGLEQTLDFYRRHKDQYWQSAQKTEPS